MLDVKIGWGQIPVQKSGVGSKVGSSNRVLGREFVSKVGSRKLVSDARCRGQILGSIFESCLESNVGIGSRVRICVSGQVLERVLDYILSQESRSSLGSEVESRFRCRVSDVGVESRVGYRNGTPN